MQLRRLKPEDAPLMLEWMHDEELVRDLHKDFASMTIDDCRKFIDDCTDSLTCDGHGGPCDIHLAVTDGNKPDPDEYMGTVSLKHIDPSEHNAEFGITIRRCAMGRGLAIEAMRRILDKASDELGIRYVYWCVSSDNKRALRFYDKNGYKRIDITDNKTLYDQVTEHSQYDRDSINRYVWYLADLTEDGIDVSVYMLTYYHEKYVRQAIESVLSQKTGYRYELVISDDCSQDDTPEILKEYAAKYPDIIRVNLNETNLGIPANIYKARTMCRGRYITNLSGDDYWIDDNKIETETRFMDEHPEYSAAACCIELRMDGSDTAYDVVPNSKSMVNRPYTIKDYEKCIPLGTHGLFMRNFFLTEEGREYFAQAREISEFVDDAVDEVLLLRKGPIYVLDITSDAHRVVPADLDKKNYNSRYTRLEKFRHHIDLLNGMSVRWGEEIDFTRWYSQFMGMGIVGMLLDMDLKGYREVIGTIPQKYNKHFKWIPYAVRFVAGGLKRNR